MLYVSARSGITGVEILTAHVITQFLVMLGQSLMVVVVALFIFDITNHGDVILVLLLTVLCGMCGMTFGKNRCLVHNNY